MSQTGAYREEWGRDSRVGGGGANILGKGVLTKNTMTLCGHFWHIFQWVSVHKMRWIIHIQPTTDCGCTAECGGTFLCTVTAESDATRRNLCWITAKQFSTRKNMTYVIIHEMRGQVMRIHRNEFEIILISTKYFACPLSASLFEFIFENQPSISCGI